ncbi:ATP/GTP-binding protein [Kitasatospora sp. NPDC085895]|uniref:ATP/GTP-binding protein n=1 Tax=Kitasatospora sp. NPDC085895 TaxID=3155057 RepID=UPI00344EFAF1
MLSHRLRLLCVLAASGVVFPLCTSSAKADGGVTTCDSSICLDAEDPGQPPGNSAGGSGGSGGGTAGEPKCVWNGHEWPCHDSALGWFNTSDGCYWQQRDPQPPAGDPDWAGHQPGDGAVYEVTCRGTGGALTPAPNQWLQNPPPGFGGGVDLGALARQAADRMLLVGPQIGMAPEPGRTGLVGMPVWMWTSVSPTTWGPNTASASAGAVTVTATAHASKIDWSMGDGRTVTCTSAGTPYQPSYGGASSPDCGHTYTSTSASQPHGKFHVTAVTTWVVDWTGAGRTGQFTLTRTSAADVAIGEAQAVVKSQ